MLGLDVLVSTANLIYLASYCVRDILWLRVLTVFGATLLLPYYYWQDYPLWTPIAWNLVFTAINAVWIFQLLRERRPVQFSDEQQRLYEVALSNLKPRDALKLMQAADIEQFVVEETIITQDQSVSRLMLIASGSVDVTKEDIVVDRFGSGRFLGAMAYLAETDTYRAPIAVRAAEATRVYAWQLEDLNTLIVRNADFQIAIEANLGRELSRNLTNARARIIELM